MEHDIVRQLQEDEDKLRKNLPISDSGVKAPRLDSSIDRKTKIARKIALTLFPVEETDPDFLVKKRYSYIRYSQLISRLSKAYKSQVEAEKPKPKGSRENFEQLKSLPLCDVIANPVAMPVKVALEGELEPFFSFLSSNQTVEEQRMFTRGALYPDGRLDLCKQVVGPPHISRLMKSLEVNTWVTHFLLGNNIIGIEGAKSIADFLKKHQRIQTWYLAGNDIDAKGIQLIAEALEADKICKTLWLKRNPLRSEGAIYLGRMLAKNSTLKVLDLHNTGLQDEGVKHLVSGLKQNRSLTHLYLDANGITSLGAEYLADYFQTLSKEGRVGVTSLWLDINRLDDSGVMKLTEALKNYPIKRLILGSNRIGPQGGKALLNALKFSTSLRVLNLGAYKSTFDMQELPNNMGNETVDEIIDFIKTNKSVELLDVSRNGISREETVRMVLALLENDSIILFNHGHSVKTVPEEVTQELRSRRSERIQRKYGKSYSQYMERLRFVRSGKYIDTIDSVYRNNMCLVK